MRAAPPAVAPLARRGGAGAALLGVALVGVAALAKGPSMRQLELYTDVRPTEVTDDARAQAHRPAPAIRFALVEAPRVEGRQVRAVGSVENADAAPHEVMFFPAGPGGLSLAIAPGQEATIHVDPSLPRPPPMPPPVPPPPQSYLVPAHARVRFVSALSLAGLRWSPGATVRVDWRYDPWRGPPATGSVQLTLP